MKKNHSDEGTKFFGSEETGIPSQIHRENGGGMRTADDKPYKQAMKTFLVQELSKYERVVGAWFRRRLQTREEKDNEHPVVSPKTRNELLADVEKYVQKNRNEFKSCTTPEEMMAIIASKIHESIKGTEGNEMLLNLAYQILIRRQLKKMLEDKDNEKK